MVQRKLPNKISIKVDQLKPNKLLVNLKPSTLQHQETKHRGPELKKKMKKSRPAAKHCEPQCLGSSTFIGQLPQPGKPPPSQVYPTTPQKKSSIKTSEATPNYMKSTTSSDARKELSRVSSRNLQALFDSKIARRNVPKSSKDSSTCDHKPGRALARTSSLKLVRTLTKTTSFKPARALATKCSPLVLSENLNVQRATCSSTLKDSKFPDYLELNRGATEADGTSMMKVCPYTYCSLNGHHHLSLPPLKSFLSAKRRLLKTQRTIKLGCLSPRRARPINNLREENKRPADEELFNRTPVTIEEQDDLFVEIYTKEMTIKETVECKVNDELTSDASPNYITRSASFRNETEAEPEDKQFLEGLPVSDEAPSTKYSAEENQKRKEADEVPESCSSMQQDVEETIESIYDSEYEPSDMDWEAGGYSTLYLDDVTIKGSQLEGISIEYDSFVIPEQSVFKPDDIASKCLEGILAGEFQEKSFDVESISSSAGPNQDFEIDEYIQEQNPDNLDISTAKNEEGNSNEVVGSELDFFTIPTNLHEHQIKDPCAADEDYKASEEDNEITKFNLQVDDETDDYAAGQTWELDSQDSETEKDCLKTHDIPTTEAEFKVQEKEQVDPDKALIRTEIVISSQGSLQPVKDKSKEDHDNKKKDVTAQDEKPNQILVDDQSGGTQDHLPDENLVIEATENMNCPENNEAEKNSFQGTASEDQHDSNLRGFSLANDGHQNSCTAKMEITSDFGQEAKPSSNNTASIRTGRNLAQRNSDQKVPETSKTQNLAKGCKRFIEENDEEPKVFNPRAPNFFPIEPEQEAEKVDLKHQMLDEQKNSEEWMLDYALQQAVTKLAPARRRKVALLVEAFETVMPVTKCDTRLRSASAAFAHAPPMQACN